MAAIFAEASPFSTVISLGKAASETSFVGNPIMSKFRSFAALRTTFSYS